MHRAVAVLPLHSGRAPTWLYQRMVRLAKPFVRLSVEEHGVHGMLSRLAAPAYIQALGSLMGFDWHASGLTTTTTAALREAFNTWDASPIRVAGGKGKTALKTPRMLDAFTREYGLDTARYTRASRLIAKIDTALVQDHAQLYHHTFFLAETGAFTVIQQGMDPALREARRYHWYSRRLRSYTCEPHMGLTREAKKPVLNLTSRPNQPVQKDILTFLAEQPRHRVRRLISRISQGILRMPVQHDLRRYYLRKDSQRLLEHLERTPPLSMPDLLLREGVGHAALRAFALTTRLLYGTQLDWSDPAVYAFAHGGKDGTPFPVNRRVYDQTISLLEEAAHAGLAGREQQRFLKRLHTWTREATLATATTRI